LAGFFLLSIAEKLTLEESGNPAEYWLQDYRTPAEIKMLKSFY